MVLNSSHWGAFRVKVKQDEIADIVPFERDTDPSPLLAGIAEAFDHPTRVRRPAVRQGWLEKGYMSDPQQRGREPFVEVSWGTALDLVAGELKRVKEQHGNEGFFGGSYGWSSAGRFHHAKTQLKRFFNSYGGCVDQVNNYSFGAGMVLLPHVVGDQGFLYGPSTSWAALAEHTELFLAFGGLPKRNTQVESGGTGNHVLKGWLQSFAGKPGALINISPLRDDVEGDSPATWCPIVPGTDTALILALCHTLLIDNRYDPDFVTTHCAGFETFATYLRQGRQGAGYCAQWASGVTGIPEGEIVALARRASESRCFIALNWSLQRADYGEQTYWAAVALAAMLGQIGLPGGGLGFGYGSMNGIGNPVVKFKTPVLPGGANGVGLSIPVSRISDLLLRPGSVLPYNGQKLKLPKIRLVYWAGGNPFHHHQDINRLVRAWQQPETIVVHENHWTSTARHADIVLPATTTLERNDIGASSSDRFLMAMQRAVPPYAEARDDHAIFSALADRLGFAETFTEGLDENGWLRRLYAMTYEDGQKRGLDLPDFDTFWQNGYFEFPAPEVPFNALQAFREDPQANPLSTPSGKIELFSEVIAGYGYADCPGHPQWLAPREWRGAPLAKRFPLHLISNQPRTRLHSQMDQTRLSQDTKIRGREPIRLHPVDAAARKLHAGDVVRVFNDRGACLAGVVISDAVSPGVVQMATGAWYDPVHPGVAGSLDAHGNPNVLTHDLGTSTLSHGCAAQSCLVELEIFQAPLPEISVNGPPAFKTPKE
jgi:biotin/methionine sulfoxide reductase